MDKINLFLINTCTICKSPKNFYLLLIFVFCFRYSSWTQCVESFENFNASTSYSSGKFVGDCGYEWIYQNARRGQQVSLNANPAISLNKSIDAKIETTIKSGGCSAISFLYEQENSANIDAVVVLNDKIIGNLSSSNEIDITKRFEITNLELSGNVNFKIKQNSAVSGQLTIDDICIIPLNSDDFEYIEPSKTDEDFADSELAFGDLIFSEIMFDPTPTIGLPDCEYIEIFNRSEKIINLSKISFFVNSKSLSFDDFNLLPKEYALICSQTNSDLFNVKNLINVKTLPALNNSGANLQLVDAQNVVIANLEYSPTWHESAFKKDGGWSLEVIDVNNICSPIGNWTSSISSTGGTPGYQNSVFAINSDSDEPKLLSYASLSDSSVILNFSEPIDWTQNHLSQFSMSENINVKSIEPLNSQNTSFALLFDSPLRQSQVYELQISEFADCADNIAESQILLIAIPDTVAPNDLIINEIMFDSDIAEYVEFYNRSNKNISIAQLNFATLDENAEIKDFCRFSELDEIIFPNVYFMISSNCENIRSYYNLSDSAICIQTNQMPNLPNTNGVVALTNRSGNIIDVVNYSEKMHSSFLNSTKNISLERINFDVASFDSKNWSSASENMNFATPCAVNSQYISLDKIDAHFTINDEIVSPNGDGINDNLAIEYSFEEPNVFANIDIFDESGRRVRRLARNQSLSTSGAIYWNATNDDGKIVPSGIYIIVAEVNNVDGFHYKKKLTCGVH